MRHEKDESEDSQTQDRVGAYFAADISIEQAHDSAWILAWAFGACGLVAIHDRANVDDGRTEEKLGRVNLVILWHMHQPQYRDPVTGHYMLPWTRLHALKDYWGMVKVLGEFPGVHATFNFVPLLAEQIEEYASGKFREPWFEVAFAPADSAEARAETGNPGARFQVNENFVHRWPRFSELQAQVRSAGAEACAGISTNATGATCSCFHSWPGWTKSISPKIRL